MTLYTRVANGLDISKHFKDKMSLSVFFNKIEVNPQIVKIIFILLVVNSRILSTAMASLFFL